MTNKTSLDPRFAYAALVASSDQVQVLAQLEAELTERMRAAADPENEATQLVQELRGLGHDLWSFDASDDFQIWCANWITPKQTHELILELRYPDDAPASVSASFQERRDAPRGTGGT